MELIIRWKFTYPLWLNRLQFQEAVGSFVADLAGINGVRGVTYEQKTHHTVTFECTVAPFLMPETYSQIIQIRGNHET